MNPDDLFNYYLEIGAINVYGIDDDGEFIFEISENAKDIAPELWESHSNYVDKSLMKLYDAGLINITYDENLEASVELSEEGYREAKRLGILPDE